MSLRPPAARNSTSASVAAAIAAPTSRSGQRSSGQTNGVRGDLPKPSSAQVPSANPVRDDKNDERPRLAPASKASAPPDPDPVAPLRAHPRQAS